MRRHRAWKSESTDQTGLCALTSLNPQPLALEEPRRGPRGFPHATSSSASAREPHFIGEAVTVAARRRPATNRERGRVAIVTAAKYRSAQIALLFGYAGYDAS